MGILKDEDITDALVRRMIEKAENIKTAKEYVSDGHSCSRASYESDADYISYLKTCLSLAHSYLQKV